MTPNSKAWSLVGDFFRLGAPQCSGCRYSQTATELHPYGEGTATQQFTTCTLGESVRDTPVKCPAYFAEQFGEPPAPNYEVRLTPQGSFA